MAKNQSCQQQKENKERWKLMEKIILEQWMKQ